MLYAIEEQQRIFLKKTKQVGIISTQEITLVPVRPSFINIAASESLNVTPRKIKPLTISLVTTPESVSLSRQKTRVLSPLLASALTLKRGISHVAQILQGQLVRNPTPLSIENANSTSFSGSTTPTVAVTTSGTDRIIVLFISANRQTDTVVVNSVAATGLTFTKRTGSVYTVGGPRPIVTEIWWAYAAAQQTAKTITVTFSVAPSDGVLQVASVVRANTTTPFDVNGSLPVTQTQTGAGGTNVPVVTGVSTTATETILFAFLDAVANTTIGAPTGFTLIGHVHEGASADCLSGWWYKIVSTPQSSISITAGSGSLNSWVYIADAIQHA